MKVDSDLNTLAYLKKKIDSDLNLYGIAPKFPGPKRCGGQHNDTT